MFSTHDDLVIAHPGWSRRARREAERRRSRRRVGRTPLRRRSVVCFPSDPLTPGDAFYLGFAGQPGRQCSCGCTVGGIGRRHRCRARPLPARHGRCGRARRGSAVPVHSDTTGGLEPRRRGAVARVPRHHEPVTVGGTGAPTGFAPAWTRRTGPAAYQASPQIRSMRGGEPRGNGRSRARRSRSATRHSGRSDGTAGSVVPQ